MKLYHLYYLVDLVFDFGILRQNPVERRLDSNLFCDYR